MTDSGQEMGKKVSPIRGAGVTGNDARVIKNTCTHTQTEAEPYLTPYTKVAQNGSTSKLEKWNHETHRKNTG